MVPEIDTTTFAIEEELDITTVPPVGSTSETEDATTEGSVGEVQDDDVDDDYENNLTESAESLEETTTMASLVTGALESVTSTISSMFGSSEVTEEGGEDSAETEKSPPADQEPGISVPDINVDLESPEKPASDKVDGDGEGFKEDEVFQEIVVPTNDAEETDKVVSEDDAISTTEAVQADSVTTEVPTDILTTTLAAQDDDVQSDETEVTTEADQNPETTTANDAEIVTTDTPLETTMIVDLDTTTLGADEPSTTTESVDINTTTESALDVETTTLAGTDIVQDDDADATAAQQSVTTTEEALEDE